MDYGFWCHAKYIYLELLFDLAWESRRGSWAKWHECDAFEALNKIDRFGSLMTDFFRMLRKRRFRAILAQEPQQFFQRKTPSFSTPIWIMDLCTGENLFFGT